VLRLSFSLFGALSHSGFGGARWFLGPAAEDCALLQVSDGADPIVPLIHNRRPQQYFLVLDI
jgi:hypothetical protein